MLRTVDVLVVLDVEEVDVVVVLDDVTLLRCSTCVDVLDVVVEVTAGGIVAVEK